jgi:hypothetical protein
LYQGTNEYPIENTQLAESSIAHIARIATIVSLAAQKRTNLRRQELLTARPDFPDGQLSHHHS